MIPEKVICPPGEAYGSHDLRTRGNWGWADITAWPSGNIYALFTGGGEHSLERVRGISLWKQEMYVYLKEVSDIPASPVTEVALVWSREKHGGYAIRKGEKETFVDSNRRFTYRMKTSIAFDPEPHAEDFGGDAGWWLRWRAEGSRMASLKRKQGESRCKVLYGEAPPPEETPQEYWIRAWSQQWSQQ